MVNNIVEECIDHLESSFIIKTEKVPGFEIVKQVLNDSREALENYILDYPNFASSLQPVKIESSAPSVIQRMAFAASLANVGPMASVAGVLVDMVFEKIWELGSRHILVENGGEIMVYTNPKYPTFKVGIFVGSGHPLNRVAFDIPYGKKIGIGTSSATIGHATSLGDADLVTVFSKYSSLADAAATAVCNMVVGEDITHSVERGIQFAQQHSDIIDGVVIIRSEKVGTWGVIPNIVAVANSVG